MKKWLVIAVVVLLGATGWYWFRPDRAVVDRVVSEIAPGAVQDGTAKVLARGDFKDAAHDTEGNATIYALPDGSRLLGLTDFETSDGPMVVVLLTAAADAPDNETIIVSDYEDLGPMKGNVGDQYYALPDSLDLTKFRCVTIWCRRFGVNFGRAPLTLNPS